MRKRSIFAQKSAKFRANFDFLDANNMRKPIGNLVRTVGTLFASKKKKVAFFNRPDASRRLAHYVRKIYSAGPGRHSRWRHSSQSRGHSAGKDS